MNDTDLDPGDPGDDDAPTDGGKLDQYDDAVIAADDTGMLSGERLITRVEIDQGLEGT
jgi:hypothetical protein